MQWMGCERWRLPNTSCLRCWVRWSSAHWRVQMRTESMSALWSTHSGWRVWSQGRTLCRFVYILHQWSYTLHHLDWSGDSSFPHNFFFFFTGFPQCSGPVSQDRVGCSLGEVLPGSVCCPGDHCWTCEHGRVGPPTGERHPLSSFPPLLAANSQNERSGVVDWPVPAEQGQHAEDAARYVLVSSLYDHTCMRLQILRSWST